jgi:hypothetical protein
VPAFNQSQRGDRAQDVSRISFYIRIIIVATFVVVMIDSLTGTNLRAQSLQVGFAAVDITPQLSESRDIWLAGYLPGRRATGVHDPIYARTVVLSDGERTIALTSVDLVGVQLPVVKLVRERLPNIDYILVSSTHSHEGPDVIGIWGPTYIHRGVDEQYLKQVEDGIVDSIQQALKVVQPATASYGTAKNEKLLRDNRLPIVKDPTLRLLKFTSPATKRTIGMLVQWNCHPEAMGAGNKEITADFCAATITALANKHQCEVAYFTGAIGGLMAPPESLLSKTNEELKQGTFPFAERYGQMVAEVASQAAADALPIQLTPFAISYRSIAIPVRNPVYRAARILGVLRRTSIRWRGDYETIGPPVTMTSVLKTTAVETEVGYLSLGELHVAAIPGELFPELVYGEFQEPVDPAADYPTAAREPTIEQIFPSDKWLLFGLANDEIGYIIPKSQWDSNPPYAYGRDKPQYGEINACAVDAAPIIMDALAKRVRDATNGTNEKTKITATPKNITPK